MKMSIDDVIAKINGTLEESGERGRETLSSGGDDVRLPMKQSSLIPQSTLCRRFLRIPCFSGGVCQGYTFHSPIEFSLVLCQQADTLSDTCLSTKNE